MLLFQHCIAQQRLHCFSIHWASSLRGLEQQSSSLWGGEQHSTHPDCIPRGTHSLCNMYNSPVLKSSKLEFDNYQSIFVWHFAYQSIPTTNVLAKYRSFLWNWTPSHIQRIYKGQNSENPLRAITFDWCVLQTWDQSLWAAFLMLFSGIPHLPTFCHVVCVTYVTSHVSRASRMSRVKCRVR